MSKWRTWRSWFDKPVPSAADLRRAQAERLVEGLTTSGDVTVIAKWCTLMDVILKCPSCESRLPVAVEGRAEQITCGRCGRAISLAFTEALQGDRAVDVCPVCEGADFYIRKDFDPTLGVAVVIIGVLVSAGFYGFGMDLVAYGVLAGVVLLDLAIYQRLGDVTVCYRCHAEFRGAYRRTASAFDLHTADELEHEYARRTGRSG